MRHFLHVHKWANYPNTISAATVLAYNGIGNVRGTFSVGLLNFETMNLVLLFCRAPKCGHERLAFGAIMPDLSLLFVL